MSDKKCLDYFMVDKDKWTTPKFSPRGKEPMNSAPGGKIWDAVSLSAGSEFIKEGCYLLDYGAGNGQLGYRLSTLLEDFTYCGLEPENSKYLPYFVEGDQRIISGLIDSDIEKDAIQKADLVTLNSVFTHLEFSDSTQILNKFLPILKRGGGVIFTCFLDTAEKYIEPGHYPYIKIPTYHYSIITEKLINEYCESKGIKYEITPNYYQLRKNEYTHRYVKLTKK